MGQAARTLNEKVQFSTGETEIVTLKYDTGKQVEGRFGAQFMYGLEDGRIMFVEPEVNGQIAKLGARKGDTIGITKRTEKQGRTTLTMWHVELIDGATDENEPPDWAQPEAQAPPMRRTVQRAEAALTAERAMPPTAQAYEAARMKSYPQSSAQVETRIERPPVAKESQANMPASGNATERDQLLKCMVSAIDAARLASRYAAEQGMSIGFSGEDVRAMGLSLYISRERAGRV